MPFYGSGSKSGEFDFRLPKELSENFSNAVADPDGRGGLVSGDGVYVPLVYGEYITDGYVLATASVDNGGEPANTLFVLLIGWCLGEIESIDQVYVNDEPFEIAAGTSTYLHYRGTTWQGVDPFFKAAYGGPYNETLIINDQEGDIGVAYSVIAIDKTLYTSMPRIKARVRGKLVRDYRLNVCPTVRGGYTKTGFCVVYDGSDAGYHTKGDDNSAYEHTITEVGSPTISGDYMTFGGSSDYLTVADDDTISLGGTTALYGSEQNFTIEGTVKFDTVTGTEDIFLYGTNSSPDLGIKFERSGTDVRISLSTNGTAWNVHSSVVLNDTAVATATDYDFKVERVGEFFHVFWDDERTSINDLTTLLAGNADKFPSGTWPSGGTTRGWKIGGFDGGLKSFRITTGTYRYGVPPYDGHDSGGPFTDWLEDGPDDFSETAALHWADMVTNPIYGMGETVNEESVNTTAYYCEELVLNNDTVRRSTTGVAITQRRNTSSWLDMLADYADATWYPAAEGFVINPDSGLGATATGPELVPNSDFSSDPSGDWTYDSDYWKWDSVAEVMYGSGTNAGVEDMTITLTHAAISEPVVFSMDITNRTPGDETGNVFIYINGSPSPTFSWISPAAVPGRVSHAFEDGLPANTQIKITQVLDFNLNIDNISLRTALSSTSAIVRGSLRIIGESNSGKANIVNVSWNNSVLDAVYTTETSEVKVGYIPEGESNTATYQMPGVHNEYEAENKGTRKLYKSLNRYTYSWAQFDDALINESGDIVKLVDGSLDMEQVVQITSVRMIGAGRWQMSGTNYNSKAYPV